MDISGASINDEIYVRMAVVPDTTTGNGYMFADNINFTPVPETSTVLLGAFGILADLLAGKANRLSLRSGSALPTLWEARFLYCSSSCIAIHDMPFTNKLHLGWFLNDLQIIVCLCIAFQKNEHIMQLLS